MDSVAMPKTLRQLPTLELRFEDTAHLGATLAQMAVDNGPIFRLKMPDASWFDTDIERPWFVFMVGPEANARILHTRRDDFSHDLGWTPIVGPLIGKGLLNMDGAAHDLHRRMMNPAFTVSYMKHYLPLMQRVVRDRTRDWAARGEIELYDETRKITFDIAAEALVGFRTGAEVDRIRDLFFALFHGWDSELETREAFMYRMMMTQRDLNMIILDKIRERRRAPTDDILGMMVQAKDENGALLSDEQILAHVNILLVAGHETTTSLSAWLFWEMALRPDWAARVRAELDEVMSAHEGLTTEATRQMKVLGYVIDEVGRLHAPVRNAPRGVVKEFEFGGYTVPVGTQIRYSIAATHMLPTVWDNPTVFDPQRFAPGREEQKRHPFAFLPFGAGPRICIGMHLATAEVKAMTEHILRSFDMTPVSGPRPGEYGMITTFAEPGLRVGVTPRE
ncbi:MAG: cytochrome P450 [Anaerolineae bacterium]